jgi:endonuclease/exonuclease/phosphatase family metal-dependent hydrolase
MECEEIARTIREHESRECHERTVVIGDLNLTVAIITTAGAQELLRGNEIPDRTKISDHLPLLFTMNM